MRKLLVFHFLAVLMTFVSCDRKNILEPLVTGISGTVTDAVTNQPIPNAIVTTEPITEIIETGESGEFQFEDLEPGIYKVKVGATGYLPQDREVKVKKDKIERVAFKLILQPLVVTPPSLEFAPNVTGRLLTIKNRGAGTLTWKITPSPEAWLQANARNGERIADGLVRVENGPTGRTDERGEVQLEGLPQGRRIRFKASKEGYLPNQFELELPIQDDLEIHLKPLPRRVRTVFEGDKPFANPEQIAINPSTGRAYVTNGKANVISALNTWGDNVMKTIPVNQAVKAGPKWARGIAVNPARNEVYVTNFWSGSVSVLDTLKNEEVAQIPVGDAPIALAASADGRTLYVTRVSKDNGEEDCQKNSHRRRTFRDCPKG